MKFTLLADRPEAVPLVAGWYFGAWGHLVEGETREKAVERVGRVGLGRDQMPYILLAVEGEEVIGAAHLKYREMEELFPEKEHWLGGVYVAASHRGRGVASRLVEEIARRAPACGVQTLYLQTEALDGGLYHRLGWQPLIRVHHHGLDVLVMERHLDASRRP
ncbi:MAG: GNAT family N-acetyltransferase [Gammaproteobacteria bacterium]|nr:GNAT family N-acetyltransferase [Gammaproteobacteria bacterium]